MKAYFDAPESFARYWTTARRVGGAAERTILRDYIDPYRRNFGSRRSGLAMESAVAVSENGRPLGGSFGQSVRRARKVCLWAGGLTAVLPAI